VFRAARGSQSLLFFDEADALFGKRSEVKDAHDRYANIEVAYLLQKFEEHDGPVILATNLRRNIDDAFSRRLHYVIEFPPPDETHRLLLWRKVFPAETPIGNDVDFQFLAAQFPLTGGDIRNVALDAAFLAAQSGVVNKLPASDQAIAGSGSCLKCHPGDYNAWIGSRHARAFSSLQEMGFHVDSSCQKCHTSIFGMAGGFVSARRSAGSELAGVSCETCHGPSASHVKDPKHHTSWPAIVQCVRCHTEENCPHFDYDRAWVKIKHGTGIELKKN